MTFFQTPSNIDLVDQLFRDPVTGLWHVPVWTFKIGEQQQPVDYVNQDPKYQERVIKHVYTRLVEKWLYGSVEFRKLLKYFDAKKTKGECEVKMISDPDKTTSSKIDSEMRKCVYSYIEKVFINKRFVEKTLRRYVKATRIKWYDLFYSSSQLKELFAHKIEKQILDCLYDMQKKK